MADVYYNPKNARCVTDNNENSEQSNQIAIPALAYESTGDGEHLFPWWGHIVFTVDPDFTKTTENVVNLVEDSMNNWLFVKEKQLPWLDNIYSEDGDLIETGEYGEKIVVSEPNSWWVMKEWNTITVDDSCLVDDNNTVHTDGFFGDLTVNVYNDFSKNKIFLSVAISILLLAENIKRNRNTSDDSYSTHLMVFNNDKTIVMVEDIIHNNSINVQYMDNEEKLFFTFVVNPGDEQYFNVNGLFEMITGALSHIEFNDNGFWKTYLIHEKFRKEFDVMMGVSSNMQNIVTNHYGKIIETFEHGKTA